MISVHDSLELSRTVTQISHELRNQYVPLVITRAIASETANGVG